MICQLVTVSSYDHLLAAHLTFYLDMIIYFHV